MQFFSNFRDFFQILGIAQLSSSDCQPDNLCIYFFEGSNVSIFYLTCSWFSRSIHIHHIKVWR